MFDGLSPAIDGFMVAPADLDRWLPQISPHLERMAKGSDGRFLPEDITRFVRDGALQLWVIFQGADILAAFLTEIIKYPRLRACRLVACVGHDWEKWAHLREGVREWAKSQGCDRMEALAPRKWRHFFTDYREDHVMFSREVG